MKTVIIYASTHHGNTKKVIEAIALKHKVDIIDIQKNKDTDISGYDCIGIASGIVFGKYYPQMLEYLNAKMPKGKKVFFIHTAGDPKEKHNAAAKAITDSRGCQCLGTYFCKGYDTYGPWKLIGGINKKHPNSDDFFRAQTFYSDILGQFDIQKVVYK